MSIIVIEFIMLEGIVADPGRSGGAPAGGWASLQGSGAAVLTRYRGAR